MLEVKDISVHYGSVRALKGVSLHVEAGEIVSVLGSNGAGKSSLLMAITGTVPIAKGSIKFEGEVISGRRPEQITRAGISIVPEGRRIFTGLTIEENLRLASLLHGPRKGEAEMENVIGRFPVLEKRRHSSAGQLSGGEQQQLAIARALVARPKLLLIDEPSLGLAPLIVDSVFEVIKELRGSGVSVLLVEQQVSRAVAVSDRTYLLQSGRMQGEGVKSDDFDEGALAKTYLGVKGGSGD